LYQVSVKELNAMITKSHKTVPAVWQLHVLYGFILTASFNIRNFTSAKCCYFVIVRWGL